MPWKTFGKANSVVQAGDIVYVRGGEYVEDVFIGGKNENPYGYSMGTESAPITWRSYPGETAIIIPKGNNAGKCCIPGRDCTDSVVGECDSGKLLPGKVTCEADADCVSMPGAMAGAAVRIYAASWNVFRDFVIRAESPYAVWRAYHLMGGLALGQQAHHNTIANIWTHDHTGNGVAVGTARFNRFEHITSENNYDFFAGGESADGFATSENDDPERRGGDNEYLYCLARNNSDDGFDFWHSTGNKVRHSVATANGYGMLYPDGACSRRTPARARIAGLATARASSSAVLMVAAATWSSTAWPMATGSLASTPIRGPGISPTRCVHNTAHGNGIPTPKGRRELPHGS